MTPPVSTAVTDRPVVLLLDGHSLAYRAFHALPVENFSTTTGQPTNAVYGFMSMLINVLRDVQPAAVAVAFDVSRTTFRTERFPDYKATRARSPVEFAGQVSLIKELLAVLQIPTAEQEGFEADDCIATLADRAVATGSDVMILTGDRDAFQLVNDRVTVLYPRKGVSDLARMDPSAIEDRFGLTPEQYADYAALRGDPSDNLPGIPGVGEKTAAKWITQYGSLTSLVDHADEIPGKVGDALRASLAQVVLNRELTALVHDVPLGPQDEPRPVAPWDVAAMDVLFETLQFTALRERLLALHPGRVAPRSPATPATPAAPVVVIAEVAAGDARAWLAGCSPPFDVACRGHWGAGSGHLDAVAIRDAHGSIAVFEMSDPADSAAVFELLSDPLIPKTMHDAKGPALAMETAQLHLAGLAVDTALAAYLAAPGQRSFVLGDVVERVLGHALDATEDGQLALGLDDDAQTLAESADAIAALAERLIPDLEQAGGLAVLTQIEVPLVGTLARMEHAGIALDIGALRSLSAEFGDEIAAAERQAHDLAGHSFNLGSPKQLQEVLFVERGLPKTKRIKTGYTTDAEALQGLFEQTGDPLLAALLSWRDRTKLRQTVDGLIPLSVDGRVHTTFNQMVAATGRLSSADPNLQNIPIRTEAGRRIRGCFVVGTGYEALLTADYSQIEMRIMAHLSQDAGLIAAFTEGEDLHTTVASRVFNVAPSDVDPEMRRRIKAMSYGLAYGLSAFGLGQQLGISPPEARTLMDEYFQRFGGIRDYLGEVVASARLSGYTETLFGRRRYLPDLTSDNRQRREMAERMALNAPIQGSAADIVKIAMLGVERRIAEAGLRSRLLLQVHDELVLEVAPGEAEPLEALVRDAMGAAADLAVPLDVSVGLGSSWEAAAH